jgi:hypothetical protein
MRRPTLATVFLTFALGASPACGGTPARSETPAEDTTPTPGASAQGPTFAPRQCPLPALEGAAREVEREIAAWLSGEHSPVPPVWNCPDRVSGVRAPLVELPHAAVQDQGDGAAGAGDPPRETPERAGPAADGEAQSPTPVLEQIVLDFVWDDPAWAERRTLIPAAARPDGRDHVELGAWSTWADTFPRRVEERYALAWMLASPYTHAHLEMAVEVDGVWAVPDAEAPSEGLRVIHVRSADTNTLCLVATDRLPRCMALPMAITRVALTAPPTAAPPTTVRSDDRDASGEIVYLEVERGRAVEIRRVDLARQTWRAISRGSVDEPAGYPPCWSHPASARRRDARCSARRLAPARSSAEALPAEPEERPDLDEITSFRHVVITEPIEGVHAIGVMSPGQCAAYLDAAILARRDDRGWAIGALQGRPLSADRSASGAGALSALALYTAEGEYCDGDGVGAFQFEWIAYRVLAGGDASHSAALVPSALVPSIAASDFVRTEGGWYYEHALAAREGCVEITRTSAQEWSIDFESADEREVARALAAPPDLAAVYRWSESGLARAPSCR